MEIENLLREEIQSELKKLKGIEEGSAEYKAVVDGITKLTDRAIEFEKFENEKIEKAKSREAADTQAAFEREMKQKQLDEQKFERELKEKQFNEMKLERELKEKQAREAKEQAEFERQLKIKQLKNDRMDCWMKIGIVVIEVGVAALVSIWGTNKSLKFEETGTCTTMAGRHHISNLFRRR